MISMRTAEGDFDPQTAEQETNPARLEIRVRINCNFFALQNNPQRIMAIGLLIFNVALSTK